MKSTLNLTSETLANATIRELARRGKLGWTEKIGNWVLVHSNAGEAELIEVAEQQANLL